MTDTQAPERIWADANFWPMVNVGNIDECWLWHDRGRCVADGRTRHQSRHMAWDSSGSDLPDRCSQFRVSRLVYAPAPTTGDDR